MRNVIVCMLCWFVDSAAASSSKNNEATRDVLLLFFAGHMQHCYTKRISAFAISFSFFFKPYHPIFFSFLVKHFSRLHRQRTNVRFGLHPPSSAQLAHALYSLVHLSVFFFSFRVCHIHLLCLLALLFVCFCFVVVLF